MTASLAPFAIFLFGAGVVALTRGWLQKAVMLLIPVVGMLNVLGLEHGSFHQLSLFGNTLTLTEVDRLSLLFGYLFHIAAFLGVLFALNVKQTGHQVAAVLYAGSALGAVFAGDMITLFVFWELLAISSVFLILARGGERSFQAAMRYLIIQILSGVVLLAGILVWVANGGTLDVQEIGLDGTAGWLILIALGVKACFPLLHNWATDAYPEATPAGTVFLSAFTTKTAVYVLARAYPGTEILIYVGAAMAMFPIFYAVIENDLRRVLVYSMINQIGFMVVGIGIGTELAINGAVSHAFNDVIFKGLLFMTMGAVLFRTGKINGSELGGLYKSMPWTTGFCIVGASSISAFPLFSGFVSKSMVMAAALDGGYENVWLALLFASAGVFHHAGIKIPFFAFFAHDSGIRVKEAPFNMLLAMGLAAFLCIFNGSFPGLLYSLLPFPVDYVPYTADHVLLQMQLLFFSALAFTLLKLYGVYPPELPGINIDAEWSYRWLGKRLVRAGRRIAGRQTRAVNGAMGTAVQGTLALVASSHDERGAMARTWSTGNMAMVAMILLGLCLAVYLF